MTKDSPEDEKLIEVLKFMKKTIKESRMPWVSWRVLEENAEKIMGRRKRPESALWESVMLPVTSSLVDEEPKAENPRIYEYKIGNSYVYIPAKMLDLYCESNEL